MDDSIWNALCKQPTLKASSEKYAQLVHDSTIQLHQSIQSILSALNLRAIGLTKCANFELALHDARVMQQLSPSSALGYLREADIYSEQGQQLQVIDICDKGLSTVDAMDTHYDTLQRAKMDAEQRQNTHIDFISQLPLDIVTTTLIPMFMDRFPLQSDIPCLYLHVSNVWRDRIVQCFDGLSFSVGHHRGYDEDTLSQVIQFAQHTKKLTINRYGHGTWLGDLLSDNDFCSLQALTIYPHLEYENDHSDHFVSSLESISKTLMHLSIELGIGLMLPIAKIMSTFPNLVSLTLPQSRVADLSSLPMTTWPNLKWLDICRAQEPITCDQTIGICRRFPSLNHLGLHPCSDIQAVFIISDYLPSMNSLLINLSDKSLDIIFSNFGPLNETIGITSITVESFVPPNDDTSVDVDSDDTFVDIGSVLKQHRKILEKIVWDMDDESNNRDIYDIQYPRLKKLTLNKSGWWIPRNAPLLEELIMTSEAINNHPAVLDTIPTNLKKLEFRLDEGPELVDPSTIKGYLDRISQHSHHLRHLILHSYTSDSIVNVLDTIYPLKQLERLMINITLHCNTHQMDRFVGQLVRGCPNLTCLVIMCREALPTHSINALKRLKNLKQCTFAMERTNDDGGSFWHALETFTQLKWVSIHPAMVTNIEDITRLKEKRPDMTINVKR
ncbi:hypothetical protein O0I10_006237 [Lichtheimia ornata]|uniref:F-box domain-containing protein n=1 Tax=Lichtheimia ornata TaxID=688661 RepID=A0AAD7XYW8_9FUNG|nr:uncharacterized protein O0I10_006237 [Lichtheimia ornata]KAJ8657966.1 hypothetical protein O0I10_006237 [Lichtheimia ornata]